MAAGNRLPSSRFGSAWDWLKGRDVSHWFGFESAQQDYDFEQQQYD